MMAAHAVTHSCCCNTPGAAEVLELYVEAAGTPLLAVAGNVDDKLDAADRQLLPQHRLMQAAGWRLLVCHIVAPSPAAKGK
jgi:predicted phosphodiesterase